MSALFGFFFGNWHRIAVLFLMLAAVSVYARFRYLETQHKADITALAHTRSLLASAQAQARLNQRATNEADHTQRVNRQTHAAVEAAQQDIAHAPDAHALYIAWTAGIERVRHADVAGTAA